MPSQAAKPAEWIGADEARSRLGVRPQTLYAYVSRGRVQVRADPHDPRRSLYRAADIASLADRKTRSRKVSDVAAGAIAWGEPVLASAITTVAGGRLFYRGRDAVALSETGTLESVARLLRGGQGGERTFATRGLPPLLRLSQQERREVLDHHRGRQVVDHGAATAGLLRQMPPRPPEGGLV